MQRKYSLYSHLTSYLNIFSGENTHIGLKDSTSILRVESFLQPPWFVDLQCIVSIVERIHSTHNAYLHTCRALLRRPGFGFGGILLLTPSQIEKAAFKLVLLELRWTGLCDFMDGCYVASV